MKKVTVFLIGLIFLTVPCMVKSGEDMPKQDAVRGIVFFKTLMLCELKDFYTREVGCSIWLDQGGCVIFQAGNMLFGFCQRDRAELEGLLTFFVETRAEVDGFYRQLKQTAVSSPRENPEYRIYHFFARDPEGRMIEFQKFLDPVKEI